MPPKLRPSDVQVYSRFASGFKQLHRKDPVKEDNADPLYLNTNVAQDGSQTGSFTKYQLISSTYPPAQLSLHPASGKGRTVESYVPIGHAASKDHYAASSERSFVGSPVSTTTRGSLHGYKPGRSTKSIYGIRGFKNPLGKDPSILSSSEMTNSRRYSFDKGRDYKLNIRNIKSKYRFGQRGGSTMTTTPAKLYRTSIDYLPFSSDSLDLIHTTTVSTPRLFTSGFNDVQPERDASTDSNPDHRQFRNYKRIYSLKGFGTQPLEGAKTLVREPDKSAALQQGFEIRSSQIWQPERSGIHRWYSETGEREPETSHIYTHRRNELSSEDFKPPIKTAGSTESVPHSRFMPDTHRKNRKIYTSPLGFQSIQNKIGNEHKKSHWKYAEQNPTIASPIHRVSSARLRSAGGLKVKSSPTSEPRTPNENKPAAMKASLLNSSTSSTVRGKRVKGKHINSKKLNESTSLTSDSGNLAIVRVHKRPAEFKAVTFADVLGSASFSSVRATTQAPVTAADKDYFPNSAAMTKQKEGGGQWTLNADDGVHSRENTSGNPEANAADEVEDFSTVGEQELGFKSREFDSGMKTFDAFLDNEGNGSGIFNQSDVLPTDTTKTQGFSEDLLELDYLRISTGNISFKSVKLSHAEK
ncbi:uncharacterized protein LOC120797021 isoform X2 [Xiphias gladius]|nr:uncharacterized protein LOC120797021 isoform X2 [Xiphias gladius]